MAFPAAPTESGGAKLHFLTTDGNAAAGWLAVDTGATGTGANTVGFAGVATHVHDDAAGAPGGLATTSVPLVLAGGVRDDALGSLTPAAGDAVYLLVDANGALWTHDDALDAAVSGSELQVDVVAALPAGTNAIGKLAANTGVDIGDVDVTSVVPGTAATNLGKAEDAGHSSGDVGVMAMSVRQNTAAALSGADADYQPLITDTNGRLHVLDANSGAIKTAVELLDDAIYIDDADWTDSTSKHLLAGGLYQSTPQTITDGDVGPLEVDSTGRLRVVAEVTASHAVTNAGTFAVQVDGNALTALQLIDNIVLAEDAAHATADPGVQMLAVRKATPADLSGADGDYEPLQMDNGRLWVTATIDGPLGGGAEAGALLVTIANDSTGVVSVDDGAGSLTVDSGAAFTVQEDGAALTALQLIDNPVAVLGTATYTEATTSGQVVGVVRNDTLATLANTDNEIAPLQVNASGALYTVLSAGSAVVGEVTIGAATGAAGDLAKIEDAQHASGDVGVMSLAVRNDALAALGGTDGDYVPLQMCEDGGLWTRPAAGPKGGCKMFTSVDLDESEEDPAAGPVTIYGIYAWNTTAAPKWLQMFNTNTVTVGTTAPTNNFLIPANADSDGAGVVIPIPVCGLAYSTALTVAATGAAGTDDTDPGASACGVAILYQD